jgi:DNA-directed RNA polymerase sigma subunit (sigma70/sigma32)
MIHLKYADCICAIFPIHIKSDISHIRNVEFSARAFYSIDGQGGEKYLEALTDQELIGLCLNGRQEAFSVLVTRYKKLIYSVVYNMINDKEEVNDISQEVFIRIYRALDRYNPEFKFSTWSVKNLNSGL